MVDLITTFIALLICCAMVVIPLGGLGVISYYVYKKRQGIKKLSLRTFSKSKDFLEQRGTNVINVSLETRPFQYFGSEQDMWDAVISRGNFSTEQLKWIKRLELPYKRFLLETPQCEEETIRLYADLAIAVDKFLKRHGSTLEKLVGKLNRSGGYYNNILYTLECIAEGEVEQHYRGGSGYNNNFSYELLEEHTSIELVVHVQNYLNTRVLEIPSPNQTTIRQLGLTPNGLPRYWWDPDGIVREKSGIDKEDYRLLQLLSFRRTKFLEIEQCRIETIKLFVRTIRALAQKLDISSDLSPRVKNFVIQIDAGARQGRDYALVHDLYKLCENTLRSTYPGGRLLNTDAEVKSIKRAFGQTGMEYILNELEAQRVAILKPTEETLAELLNQNPNIWKAEVKSIKEHVTDTNYLEQFEEAKRLVRKYQRPDSMNNIYWELFKVFAPHNKLISLYLYVKYFSAVQEPKDIPPATRKLLLNSDKEIAKFTTILAEDLEDDALLSQLKAVFVPTRRKVEIDPVNVEQIIHKHTRTVQKLSKYMQTDEEETSVVEPQAEKAMTTLDDIFVDNNGNNGDIEFTDIQLKVIRLFKEKKFQLSSSELKAFAHEHNLFLNTLVSGINQIFYNGYEDQLILESEEGYEIDNTYISIIKQYV